MYVRELDLLSDSNASRRHTGSSVTRKSLGRSQVFLPLDQLSETTSHQKWQEDQLQHSELRTLPLSLVYRLVSSTSSSPTSLASSSQESVTLSEHPASTRSESVCEEVQGNVSHGPAEIENPNKNDDNEEVQGNLSHDLPEWQQEFRHGLVDESVPEHRDASSSSHELTSDPRAKVVSGKHSIFTHFPKDPKLRYLPENQHYKGFLQKTHWYSRAPSGKCW